MNKKIVLQRTAWVLAAILLFLFFNFVPLHIRWSVPAEEAIMDVIIDDADAVSDGVWHRTYTPTTEEKEAFIALLTAQPFRRLKTEHRDMYADEQYVYFKIWDGKKWTGLHVVLPSETYGDGYAWTDSKHLCLDPAPFYDLARSYIDKAHSPDIASGQGEII